MLEREKKRPQPNLPLTHEIYILPRLVYLYSSLTNTYEWQHACVCLCVMKMFIVWIYKVYRTPLVLGTSLEPVRSTACLMATARDLKADSALSKVLLAPIVSLPCILHVHTCGDHLFL